MWQLDSEQMRLARMALYQSLHTMERVRARDMYAMLELYYYNNGLYDAIKLSDFETGIWTEAMKPLRNPVNRCVEFFVSTVWPGPLETALPIVTKNEAIIEPIRQVWAWSNWGNKKQLAIRWFANLGDLFIKVPTRSGPDGKRKQVFLQLVKPHFVTDLDEDERGYLTYIRIDQPASRRQGDKVVEFTYTEVWDKLQDRYRAWEHDKGPDEELSRLGDPVIDQPITAYGFDFIPIVHQRFRDVGDVRGACAYMHALDKIDELNRMVTRMHQMMFRWNKAHLFVKVNGVDPHTGQPLPPPRVERINPDGSRDQNGEISDSDIISLPGMADIGALVPQINYEAYLKEIQAQTQEIEQDLPELAYYRVRELGSQISGKAVRLLFSDAIDRTLEARGNAEEALVRANQMALTIGQVHKIFSGLGDYEAGALEHTFKEREVIPVPESEQAETTQTERSAGVPLVIALRRRGWTEDELQELEKELEKERREQEESLANAMRKFDQGGAGQNNGFARKSGVKSDA